MVGREAGRGEDLGEHPHRGDATEPVGGDRLADEALELGLAHRLVERWREPHPLLGVGHDGIRELRRARCACSPRTLIPCTAATLAVGAAQQVCREVVDRVDDGVRVGRRPAPRARPRPTSPRRRPSPRRARRARRRSRRRRRRSRPGPRPADAAASSSGVGSGLCSAVSSSAATRRRASVDADAHQARPRPTRGASRWRRTGGAGRGERREQLGHPGIAADQALGVGGVPLAVDAGRARAPWSGTTPRAGPAAADGRSRSGPVGLLDLLGEHRAERVLVGVDDEGDGVGERAVEVEEHDPVAEGLLGCRCVHPDSLPTSDRGHRHGPPEQPGPLPADGEHGSAHPAVSGPSGAPPTVPSRAPCAGSRR